MMRRGRVIPLQAAPPEATHGPGTGAGRWRAARLLDAPHRLSFFAAAVLMAGLALWWLMALTARWLGLALPWAVSPSLAHGLALALGFMPLFITGFAFTAGPRWLGLPEVSTHRLLRPVLAMVTGWGLAVVGFHASGVVAGVGLVVASLGWLAVLGRFARMIAASPAPDRLHARGVLAAGIVGAMAMLAGAAGLALPHDDLARIATRVAVWGFLAPTFTVVTHRMLPFFTAGVLPDQPAWRPDWVLWALLATLGVAGAGEIATLATWPGTPGLHAALALLLAPGAVLTLWLTVHWGLWPARRQRLLAMLHGGFAWLGVALALQALSHGLAAWQGGAPALGLAPLHALTIGHLGATLVAMITRVAAGHSGRPVAADAIVWRLYLALQAAAVLRVAAAVWVGLPAGLMPVAAALWAVACGGWAWRYGSWFGRPRADGRPG
jgi:uncharacterized protein involved in response to NO